MRTTVLFVIVCLAPMLAAANASSDEAPRAADENRETNTSPLAADTEAESESRAAWEMLTKQVPDLGGVDQGTSARRVPRPEQVAEEQRYCVRVAKLGTRIKRRVCFSKEEWIADQMDNRSMREAVFFHGMSH